MNKPEVIEYVASQKSLHLYKDLQEAFIDVLGSMTEKQFEYVKSNLIVMAFHHGTVGQVMHFSPRSDRFSVMQLYMPKNMPSDVMKWVVAHELGHVMQKRNSEDSDGMKLEDDATKFAKGIGYPKTEKISEWLAAEKSYV